VYDNVNLHKDVSTAEHWLSYTVVNVVVIVIDVGIFTARCTVVQSAALRLHVVRPSVRPSVASLDQNDTDWKSWKLFARTISPTPSLFEAQRPSTYSQGTVRQLLGQ